MKTLRIFQFIALLLASSSIFGQITPGTAPCTSTCTTSGSYPSGTGTSGMGSWGCLGSTPNPNWVAIGAGSNGYISLQLTQTNGSGNGIDVDFGVFGPFTSISAGCSSIITGSSPMVDCSFSSTSVETIEIPNASIGQIYIILITNYSGQSGTISLTPTSGTVNCNGISFNATATSTPATCNQPNGSVTVTPNGGVAPYTYLWNTPGNPTTQTVTNVPPGTYTVTIGSSPNPTNGQPVPPATATVTVANLNASYSSTSTPASCPMGHNGTATANFSMAGGSAGITASYSWNDPAGQMTKTATGLLPGTYICTIALSNGCVGTVTVTVGANPVAYSSSSTLVSCPGGSDGTATATMAPVVGTLSYAWNDPSAQSTQVATGLTAGSYTCVITSTIGCTGTVNVTVSEIPGMIATFSETINVSCNSGNDGHLKVAVIQGTPPYSYAWDHSASTTHTASDLFVGISTVTVTDALGCVVSASETLTQPDPLQINFLTSNQIICPEASTTLNVTGIGGNGAANGNYTFTWKENGTVIGTGESIVVDPLNDSTTYCVELTEVCGSPSTDSCMVINFPTPIVPIYRANKPYSCLPGDLVFYLDTTNLDQDDPIDSVIVHYGNGDMGVVYGNDSIHYIYTEAGLYTIDVTVTSDLGCVTTGTFQGIANVIANPVADFTFSANPTTIFETVVKMQDKSSPNVINWTWYSPGSTPNSSTYESPTFTFPEGVVATYTVQLIVETPEGCIDTTERILSVNSDIIFYAPNAFTPDGDEFNQTWKFYVSGIDEFNFELLIFNRWGEVIWETHDVNSTWDGTYNGAPCKEGAYSWVARVKDTYSDKKMTFNGAINILK
ncbi:gliding motility-associated C-terminal domain-containing protein [Fluviicola taffensis]|uniref:PKD domain containing protein n=1 Tax=Fluviicola taffensis (strain DSM 16823 / NCIMB 13979 / RW262) TaxID=755732 RepID=F2IFQ8_FLUTR|nr:gliding motility-associated C-terminal domain-containing protein [Fluviicola taffensis]AEA42516.1 PKD domain containing protein [Fluviicola taffensis DSM 16823]